MRNKHSAIIKFTNQRYLVLLARLICFASILSLASCEEDLQSDKKQSRAVSELERKESIGQFLRQTDSILITAHRGDWRNAPENSLQALQACIEKGIDIMETDLKMTKDGYLILMHDETLDRTTTGKGFVKDWTLDSIRNINLRNGYGYPTPYKVPTLEEALLLARGKLIIDLDKSYPYMREAYHIAKKTETLDQVIFRVNDEWDELYKKHGEILDEINYMPLIWWNTKEPTQAVNEYLNAPFPPVALEMLVRNEEDSVLLTLRSLDKINCRIMMNAIYPHLCASHDDHKALTDPGANWGWMIDQGVNIIGTDRPGKLKVYLASRKTPS